MFGQANHFNHIEQVIPVVDAALASAGVTLADLDAIAVTCGPGLIGALLVAVQTAKAMAYGAGKPLVHATFPMEQTREAHALMESSAHLGKIMVTTGR